MIKNKKERKQKETAHHDVVHSIQRLKNMFHFVLIYGNNIHLTYTYIQIISLPMNSHFLRCPHVPVLIIGMFRGQSVELIVHLHRRNAHHQLVLKSTSVCTVPREYSTVFVCRVLSLHMIHRPRESRWLLFLDALEYRCRSRDQSTDTPQS